MDAVHPAAFAAVDIDVVAAAAAPASYVLDLDLVALGFVAPLGDGTWSHGLGRQAGQ